MSVELFPTGIEGLDAVLHGGFQRGRIVLIQGAPGTGKTTLALQMMAMTAKRGETALFLSIAQSRSELEMIAASHGLDLGPIHVHTPEPDGFVSEDTVSVETEEAALVGLLKDINHQLDTVRPDVFVFDSLLELRLLAVSEAAYRRELLALRRRLRKIGATTLLLDHLGSLTEERHAEGIAHGVIQLECKTPPIGVNHRRLTVTKMRGAAFREGFHDFAMQRGGIVVFPRVIPREAAPERPVETLPVENETLRAIVGGGFEFGSSLLISGQSGTGKSTLATLIARSAALDGFPAAMFLFEERPEVMRTRSESLGMRVKEQEEDGSLRVAHFDPAEISPGQFSHAVIAQVSAGARVVVIDSLSGYLNALPDRDNVVTHLHSLLQYLARNHVLTVVTLAQHGLLGEPPVTELDTSYLADSIILLRQYEEGAEIRRSIAVLKKRAGMHSRAIQELVIDAGLVDIRPLDVATSRRAGQAAQLSGP